jgi:flagellar secretion chaperone FliS
MNAQALRNRYAADTVATVSPAKLVTMLYDALVRDLVLAEAALDLRNLAEVNDRLCHAQDIVMELHAGLEVDRWSGGKSLAQLYTYLLTELIQANVHKDVERVAACRGLIEPLRDAWHQAAASA